MKENNIYLTIEIHDVEIIIFNTILLFNDI